MRTAVMLVFIALLVGCSQRYETKTADGMTLRTDKSTGKTEVMVKCPDGRLLWVAVADGSSPSAAATGNHDPGFWKRAGFTGPCH
jgi:hypothetical protein